MPIQILSKYLLAAGGERSIGPQESHPRKRDPPIVFVDLLKHYSTQKGYVHPHTVPRQWFRCVPPRKFGRKEGFARPGTSTPSPAARSPAPRPRQSPSPRRVHSSGAG